MIISNLFNTTITCDKYNVNTESNSTVTLTVTCKDFNGSPVIGQEVNLYYDNTLLTTSFTNSNGVITYSRDCASDSFGIHTFTTDTGGLTQIEVYRDTGWNDVTFSSGYTHYDSNNKLQYRVVNYIGEISGIFKNNNAVTPSSATTFASIPSKYAPSRPVYSLEQGSVANKFLLLVNTNGTMSWQRYGTTATNTQASAGAWLHGYIKYTL